MNVKEKEAYSLHMSFRYLLALGLLAGLAFADYLILKHQILSTESDAAQINTSGRQRMLVERTALLARYLVSTPDRRERANVREQLFEAIQLLEQYQDAMIHGDPSLRLPGNPPPEVRALYFGPPMFLQTRLRNYLTAVKVLSRTPDAELTPQETHLGYIRTVASGKMLAALDHVVDHYQKQSEAKIARVERLERWIFWTTFLVLGATGLFIFRPMVRRVHQEMDRLAHSYQELNNVTKELLKVNEKLERLALLDPLTELLNRRGLQQALSVEIQRIQRDPSDLHVLLVDLDDFKTINDTLGHAVGDIVLKEVALKLKASLRVTDYVARIGGDEFMILLPQTRRAEGMQVAEKVRFAIAGAKILLSSGKAVQATASLGFMAVSQETPSIDELLTETHVALSKSKEAGKNRVSYNLSGLRDEELVKAGGHTPPKVDMALRRDGKLRVVKQPIFHLDDLRNIGYEFLSRSSVVGFEMPDDFFRACLEANILTLVDHRCLKICIAAAISLPPEIRRHLNLFPSTLIDIPVQHLVETIPRDSPQGTYCIEISEQQIIGDPSYLVGAVNELKRAHLLVAIDDVGFGWSSLESLILLEPDIVKIDKRYVHEIAKDLSRRRSLKRLLKVTEDLGTEVMAEGIESQEDLEVLRDLGVRYGQGFLLGRPA